MSVSLFVPPRSVSRRTARSTETQTHADSWSHVQAPPPAPPELHTVIDSVLSRVAPDFQHVIATRPCKSDLHIRMDETVLSRVLYALLRGMFDAREESGEKLSHLLISTRKCLNGFGAVLELSDDGPALPRKLLFHLSQMESSPIREIPGWHLLVARDLVESHGGRLLVQSPPRGLNAGAAVRLFLPLSTNRQAQAGPTEREVFHVAI